MYLGTRKHSNCFVCRTVLKGTDMRCREWSPGANWHTTLRFCRPCWHAMIKIAVDVAREYE